MSFSSAARAGLEAIETASRRTMTLNLAGVRVAQEEFVAGP